MIVLCIGIFGGFLFGVSGLLVVQGSERAGREAQHARDLGKAYALLREAESEFETRYANLASAFDAEVRKNHTFEMRRVQAWKALETAARELHADPSPKCVGCGDSIVHDKHCFICGLHDIETALNQGTSIAQA